MRDIDDKIIYALNTSLPTESFKGQISPEKTCSDLCTKLQAGHQERKDAIKKCISISVESIKVLRSQREQNPDDTSIDKRFKSEHRKVCLTLKEYIIS